ncbi:Bcr/CflA family efflux MFS transporter [Comamonas piscis]|uniref:Bcr/CflA family efflux transporter n=1 Tax=Comamonas piscis TaxID=1562974 RepID=A0A7G5EH56_9BURK|nr:Bcr/CflA family efflux MFS transporter [Comamonas piscis]QMV73331.1 Bcr/CflA family efflux MFS transporter [Comamonas piscis]WSO36132.1 Bcr/CflA family efflux MFS transporter [Comamonas piscis]
MTQDSNPPGSGLRFAASLALIAVLGPSATDMYLASMPEIAAELAVPYAQVQLTLTVFLLAMGLGQLLLGPIVDAFGRRRPLLAGLLAFALASLWASQAPSIGILLTSRFVQGLAGALTLVVVMSSVRDVAKGARAAQLFALLMTIEGLAPVLAPAVGGYVDVHYGWRGVMLVLAAMGLLVLLNSAVALPETLPRAARLPLRLRAVASTYARIASDRSFLLPALALSSAFFVLFIYIAGASLVYQQRFGLSPDRFGLVFGATGVAVLMGAVTSVKLVQRAGVARLAVIGAMLMLAGSGLALAAAAAQLGLPGIVLGMFIAMWGLGMAEATLMSMAMGSQHSALGSTAALLGAFQLSISSAATPLAGKVVVLGTTPWLGFMLLASALLLLLTRLSAKQAPASLNALAGH